MFRISSRMQRVLLLALAVLLLRIPAAAQYTRSRRENATRVARTARNVQATYSHRWEINAGGGFLRFSSGSILQRNSEVTWTTGLAYNLNPRLSVVGDIRGMYGDAKVGNNFYNVYNPLISQYTFLVGPQYRFYRHEKLSVSVSGLGGVALGNFDGGTHAIPAYVFSMWDTANRPAFSANLNFDYNLYPNLAFRVTPTYLGTLFHSHPPIDPSDPSSPPGPQQGSVQNNLGMNFGLVYRFGRQ